MKASRLLYSIVFQKSQKGASFLIIRSSNRVISTTSRLPKIKKSKPWYHIYTSGNPQSNEYMAKEWGVETYDERELFEKLSLEGAASGLSWFMNVLNKREAYRKLYHNFEVTKVAEMGDNDVERVLEQPGDPRAKMVIRNRSKLKSVITNAKCILKLRKENVDFGPFLWSFVDNKPILTKNASYTDLPTMSKESMAMSKALQKRGFEYVDPETCYSLMQSVGMVIDHPKKTPEWEAAKERLEQRPGGYQDQSLLKQPDNNKKKKKAKNKGSIAARRLL